MKPTIEMEGGNFVSSSSAVADWATLMKVRISVMVVFSTLVGYILGAQGPLDMARLIHTLLATFLTSAGAGVLNQVYEREADGCMVRTADRPLPAGRISIEQANRVGLILTAFGILYLGIAVNGLTVLVGALTSGSYLLLYTPLKQRTPHNTAVGAVSGALPPVGGWTAATGQLGGEALALFGILFLWQFPHFYAIAWMYRDDYARGGYRMLSVDDPGGDRTAHQVVLYSLVLLSCSLMPALLGIAGPVYFSGAVVLGLIVLWQGLSFAQSRTDGRARSLLRSTLIYLPALWLIMVLDKTA